MAVVVVALYIVEAVLNIVDVVVLHIAEVVGAD